MRLLTKLFLCVLGLLVVQDSTAASGITCYDESPDIKDVWSFPEATKYVTSKEALPGSVSKLNLAGTGLWYLEGTGPKPKLSTFVIKHIGKVKPYTTRNTKVQLSIRYHDSGPRQGSVSPSVQAGGQFLLPITSSTTTWRTATVDINPRGESIELSYQLGEGQFVVIDKLILSVDQQLPADVTSVCKPAGPPTVATLAPTKAAARSGGAVTDSTTSKPGPNVVDGGSCLAYAQPECKCNCMCNCVKCT